MLRTDANHTIQRDKVDGKMLRYLIDFRLELNRSARINVTKGNGCLNRKVDLALRSVANLLRLHKRYTVIHAAREYVRDAAAFLVPWASRPFSLFGEFCRTARHDVDGNLLRFTTEFQDDPRRYN